MTWSAEGRLSSAPLRTFAIIAATLIVACHPTPRPRPATLAARPSLDTTITQLLAAPELSRGSWGVSIRSLDKHDVVFEKDANRLLMPASTLKIVTLAVAAERLGWDYSYSTSLLRTGNVINGTLDGHLIVVGSGDPSFDDWDGNASKVFAGWAARLRDSGINTVAGHVIGDNNVFDDTGLGVGWMWDDATASYSAPVSGLQFNENSAQLIVAPGRPGEPATISVQPASAPLTIRNRALSAATGAPLRLLREPYSDTITVSGVVSPSERPVVRNVAVSNPTLYFAEALRASLISNGINVERYALNADDYPTVDRHNATVVGEARSAPLATIGATMMQLSQNLFAESLLKTLGRAAGKEGTTAAGRDVVFEQLTAWGIPADDLVMVDGSGLSRYNLMTAAAQTAILARVYGDTRLRDPFVATLPIAGASGTLERRMAGTAAANNARAKTGSFSNARAVAGYVRTAGGEMLAFSIIANNYNAPAATVDRAADAIVAALAEFRR